MKKYIVSGVMVEAKVVRRARRKLQILTLCLILTVCICTILAGLLIWALSSRTQVSPTEAGFVRAAAALSSNMDTTAEPCEDFYQYACGGWMKRNVIPDDADSWSNFVILSENTAVILYNLLSSLQLSEEPKPEYLTKVLDFYSSCTREEDMAEDGISDTVREIREAADSGAAIRIAAQYNIYIYNVIFTEPDNSNPDTNALYIMQGGLGLSLKEEYNNTSSAPPVVEKQGYYKKYVRSLWANYDSSLDSTALDSLVTKIWDFESCVADGMKHPDEERNDFAKMPSTSFTDLKSEVYASKLLLETTINARLSTEGSLPDHTKVYFFPELLSHTATCVSTHLPTESDVKDYASTRMMLQFAPAGTREWRDIAWQWQVDITKVQVKPPQWKTCVFAITNYMPEALGRIFVEETFKDSAKTDALAMIEDIKSAFKKILPTLTWMDEATRRAAVTKADAVGNKIGYPDWIMKDDTLTEYLSEITISKENVLANTMSADKALVRKSFNEAGKKVDTDKWYMSSATVNAYYNPKGNEMVFPAAILQPPFYHVTYPSYVNYGAIGVVIGHELTHGFDDNGRLYDQNGFLKEWYSEEAVRGFNARAACMSNQYSSYSIMGNQVNGNLTLGENIADNGGVKQAYEAYRSRVERHGEEPTLPGLSLSNDQAFFLSYAQIWCQKKTTEAYHTMTKTDWHSPGRFRIKGPLVNSREFAAAYGCQKDAPMNPSDKCEVW